jgi:hypothetical protein
MTLKQQGQLEYLNIMLCSSVSDPYYFFPDPDTDPEVEAGDQYGEQKLKKNYS